jgi:hypothetical protein
MTEQQAALAAECQTFWQDLLAKLRFAEARAATLRGLRFGSETVVIGGLFPARVEIRAEPMANKHRVACSKSLARHGGLFATAAMLVHEVTHGLREELDFAHDGWRVVAKITGYYGPDGSPVDPFTTPMGAVSGRKVELHIQPVA